MACLKQRHEDLFKDNLQNERPLALALPWQPRTVKSSKLLLIQPDRGWEMTAQKLKRVEQQLLEVVGMLSTGLGAACRPPAGGAPGAPPVQG